MVRIVFSFACFVVLATTSYPAAPPSTPSVATEYQRGVQAFQAGRVVEARVIWQLVLAGRSRELTPDQVTALKGCVARADGRLTAAQKIDALEKTLQVSAALPDVHFELANLLLDQPELDRARALEHARASIGTDIERARALRDRFPEGPEREALSQVVIDIATKSMDECQGGTRFGGKIFQTRPR